MQAKSMYPRDRQQAAPATYPHASGRDLEVEYKGVPKLSFLPLETEHKHSARQTLVSTRSTVAYSTLLELLGSQHEV